MCFRQFNGLENSRKEILSMIKVKYHPRHNSRRLLTIECETIEEAAAEVAHAERHGYVAWIVRD
jgi:hypothetical protein